MYNENEKVVEEKEELRASTVLKIVCFLIPLVGLIIYACNISINRKFATECGKISLISVIIAIILPLILIGASLILGVGIYSFNGNTEAKLEEWKLDDRLKLYEGESIEMSSVNFLLSVLETDSYEYIDIIFNDKKYSDKTKVKEELKSDTRYSVKFEKNRKGKINKVVIKEGNTVKIPKLDAMKIEEAKEELEKLGLKITVIEEYHDYIREGRVYKLEPISYSIVNKGDTITLYVSKGKESDNINNIANNVERGE